MGACGQLFPDLREIQRAALPVQEERVNGKVNPLAGANREFAPGSLQAVDPVQSRDLIPFRPGGIIEHILNDGINGSFKGHH